LFTLHRDAIEGLGAEGHVFSTVDDDHYKCTDWQN